MSLPTVDEVRKRISQVPDEDGRFCLMAIYLFDARVSEVVSRKCPSDLHTNARGPRGVDVRRDLFGAEDLVALFSLKTAKRGGLKRVCALPMNKEYEPWTLPLFNYFFEKGSKPVFPFIRQYVGKVARESFKGLKYPIERYVLVKKTLGIKKVIDAHSRPFNVHALRHLRASELVEVYGFDGFNLAVYGGWTFHTMAGTTSIMDRYLSLSWQSYFPKLLRRRI